MDVLEADGAGLVLYVFRMRQHPQSLTSPTQKCFHCPQPSENFYIKGDSILPRIPPTVISVFHPTFQVFVNLLAKSRHNGYVGFTSQRFISTNDFNLATMTMSRPINSSPLADSSNSGRTTTPRIIPQRNASFPSSRALRPFPTISHALQPNSSSKKPPVKIIEPPKNHKGTFLLNLTQAEFSRQE